MISGLVNYFSNSSLQRLMLTAFLIRVAVVIYGLIHDTLFSLPYTDVDYLVVTDGARHMAEGRSPFERETYRYTPLLAAIFVPATLPGFSWWGKLVVCFCDVLAGYYVVTVLRQPGKTGSNSVEMNNGFSSSRGVNTVSKRSSSGSNSSSSSSSSSAKFLVSCFIWFNPVVINVSTRGNSDIIITALALASLVSFTRHSFVAAGLFLGFAVHMKIYPIIYAAPFVFCLFEQNGGFAAFGKAVARTLPQILVAAASTLVGAALPTYGCYLWYGQRFLDEAILYHVGRVDHRHNLSPYFLQMYYGLWDMELAGSAKASPLTASLIAFVPQLLMLVTVSWILRRNASHAITIETMLFVAFNKVCTVQYFVWYLPFLPFIFHTVATANNNGHKPNKQSSGFLLGVVALWVISLLGWMLTGKGLEFDGKDNFSLLWICSCVFFVAQVLLAVVMMRRALGNQQQPQIGKLNVA